MTSSCFDHQPAWSEQAKYHGLSADTLEELVRLSNKAPLVTEALGGLLPGLDCAMQAELHTVVELACGPGGWTLEMAQRYPWLQIIGLDCRREMLAFAQATAQQHHLNNVEHRYVTDQAGPFDLPDASIDLISAVFLSRVLRKTDWSRLLDECKRLLRPGGWLRLTELEAGLSNAPAHEELIALFLRAMHRAGHSLAPTDRHLGLLCELEPMLTTVGFRQVSTLPHLINY